MGDSIGFVLASCRWVPSVFRRRIQTWLLSNNVVLHFESSFATKAESSAVPCTPPTTPPQPVHSLARLEDNLRRVELGTLGVPPQNRVLTKHYRDPPWSVAVPATSRKAVIAPFVRSHAVEIRVSALQACFNRDAAPGIMESLETTSRPLPHCRWLDS